MAGVSLKQSLGNLFGGKIASINYSFETSSQPSTATITVINEDQKYQEPKFGTTVAIPPFGIQMEVVSVTRNKQDYEYLQVELVEKMSRILDRQLVLIYGLHTTHKSELNKNFYWTFKSYFVNKDYWNAPAHPDMDTPVYPDSKTFSMEGINVIGLARATINDIKSTPINNGSKFAPDAGYLKFDKGIFRSDISTALPSQWQFNHDGPPNTSIQYGYYLSELRDLLIDLGVSFKDDSEKYLENDTVLFSDAGTIREVLSSALSKIGMSFYVDPISQAIKIITNADIAKMNAGILSRHKFFNEGCARQISYTESIKDVEAQHLVIKGDLNQKDVESAQFGSDPVKRRDKLYRVAARNIVKNLTKDELNYIYKFLPLVLMGIPDHIIESYIFGTAVFEDTTDWGELYGENEFVLAPDTYPRKEAKKPFGSLPATKEREFWVSVLTQSKSYGFFDAQSNGDTAINIYRDLATSQGGGATDPISPEDEYLPYIKAFASMWGGIYISDAMNEDEAESRVYAEITRRGQQVTKFIAPAEAFISEYTDLSFLVKLLQEAGNRSSSVTIKDLARIAGANTDIVGSNYHVVCIQHIGLGEQIENLPSKIARYIGANMVKIELDTPVGSNTYLLGSKGFRDTMKSLQRNLASLLRESLKKRYDYILLSYFKTQKDPPSGESETNPFVDTGTPNFIRNIEAQEENFYKRSLNVMQMGVSEAELFLQEFGDLNPKTPSPLISSSIEYSRPPQITDFNIENGLNSLSVSISAQGGITTSARFSSRRFARVDRNSAFDYLGSDLSINRTTIPSMEPDYRDAFRKT